MESHACYPLSRPEIIPRPKSPLMEMGVGRKDPAAVSEHMCAINNPQDFPKGPVAIYLSDWVEGKRKQPFQGVADTGSKLTPVTVPHQSQC